MLLIVRDVFGSGLPRVLVLGRVCSSCSVLAERHCSGAGGVVCHVWGGFS